MVSKMETDHTGKWQRPKERCFLCVATSMDATFGENINREKTSKILPPSIQKRFWCWISFVNAVVSAVRLGGGRWGSRRADWLDWDWRHGAATSHSSDCGRGKPQKWSTVRMFENVLHITSVHCTWWYSQPSVSVSLTNIFSSYWLFFLKVFWQFWKCFQHLTVSNSEPLNVLKWQAICECPFSDPVLKSSI